MSARWDDPEVARADIRAAYEVRLDDIMQQITETGRATWSEGGLAASITYPANPVYIDKVTS